MIEPMKLDAALVEMLGAEAIEDFDVALCFESNPNLYLNKALSLLELGRRAEVVATLRALPRHSRRSLIEPIADLAPFIAEAEANA